MKLSAATIYHLDSDLTIEDADQLPRWEQPGKRKWGSIGLIPLDGIGFVESLGNSGVWFQVRLSEKKVPDTEVKLRMAELIEKYETETGKPVKGARKAEIRENVLIDMIETALPTHTAVDVLVTGDWLLVMSASGSVCDTVTQWVREHLGALAITPAAAKGDLLTFAHSLVAAEGLNVDTISIGAKINGKRADMSVSFGEADYDSSVKDMISQMTELKSCELCWSDFRAVIKEDFSLSGIKTEFKDDSSIEEIDDKFLRSKAEAFYYAQRLPNFLRDVCLHIGGFQHEKEAV